MGTNSHVNRFKFKTVVAGYRAAESITSSSLILLRLFVVVTFSKSRLMVPV